MVTRDPSIVTPTHKLNVRPHPPARARGVPLPRTPRWLELCCLAGRLSGSVRAPGCNNPDSSGRNTPLGKVSDLERACLRANLDPLAIRPPVTDTPLRRHTGKLSAVNSVYGRRRELGAQGFAQNPRYIAEIFGENIEIA